MFEWLQRTAAWPLFRSEVVRELLRQEAEAGFVYVADEGSIGSRGPNYHRRSLADPAEQHRPDPSDRRIGEAGPLSPGERSQPE